MLAETPTPMEVDRLTDEAAIQRGAPAVLVDRMLTRVMSRPGLLDAVLKGFRRSAELEARVALRGVLEAVAHLPADNIAKSQQTKQAFEETCDIRPYGDSEDVEGADRDADMVNSVAGQGSPRQKTNEACRRRLYVCIFAAGVNAHMLAQLCLLQTYKTCASLEQMRIFGEDDNLLPLVQRLCGPVEWARTSACCRQFRALGLAHRGLLSYWLRGYSAEGQKEAMKHAIQHNVIGLIRPLVDANADMNCVFEQYWFRTPLHRAASRGHVDLCKLLLSLRANASLRDSHGASPIHLVASKGRLAIVDLLLRHDCNSANAVDYSARTPCHMAALKGHLSCVQHLAAKRGNISAQASDGRTPRDMALRGQHTEIVLFLDEWSRRLEEEVEVLRTTRHVLATMFRRASDRENLHNSDIVRLPPI